MKLIVADCLKIPQDLNRNLSAIAITIERFISFVGDKYRWRHEGYTYFRRDQLIGSHPLLTEYFIDKIAVPLLKRFGFLETIQPFRFKKDATQFFKFNFERLKTYGFQIWSEQSNFLLTGDREIEEHSARENREPNTYERDINTNNKQCYAKTEVSKKASPKKVEDIVSRKEKKSENADLHEKGDFSREKPKERTNHQEEDNRGGNSQNGGGSRKDWRTDPIPPVKVKSEERKFTREKLKTLFLEKLDYTLNSREISCLLRYEFAEVVEAIAAAKKQLKKKTIKSIPAYVTGVLKRWKNQGKDKPKSPPAKVKTPEEVKADRDREIKAYVAKMKRMEEEARLEKQNLVRLDPALIAKILAGKTKPAT